ncbi:helix-turn-helix transcriptional regulator [Nakamurella endophytica]|nr:helix-turn-helix transcriptional regulator [Nakamurella endophytica]
MAHGRRGQLTQRVLGSLPPGLDHVELRRDAARRLRGAVGDDVAVWAVLDPATLLWASCVVDGADRDVDLENAVFDNEYRHRDVLSLRALAQGPLIGTLHQATAGAPADSARYRDVYRPRGITDELRLVMHDGETAWGALCLLRSGGTFAADEVAAVGELGRPFARALRKSVVRPAATPDGDGAAGLLLASLDGRVLDVNPEARRLLGDLDQVPQVVQAVAARRRAGAPASAAAPTPTGRWLAFHATELGPHLAVVVEQVRPPQLADLVVRARGLTPRERAVLELVARGLSNRRIAGQLGISEFTVGDHLKALFAKFDVGSRSELVAALFFDHFAPLHAAEGGAG